MLYYLAPKPKVNERKSKVILKMEITSFELFVVIVLNSRVITAQSCQIHSPSSQRQKDLSPELIEL